MKRSTLALTILLAAACSAPPPPPAPPPIARHSILLVTLDTTRADSIGPDAKGVTTPAFNGLAARGTRFRHAYATVPETLPAHASMMTGLYPAGHGIHENARTLPATHALVAERLQQAGYHTAAFVSSFVLAKRFGLARGFDAYDDELAAGSVERSSQDTTDRAIAHLSKGSGKPTFTWVHYFDPHTPYTPSYTAEIETMDAQLGRLVQAFERHVQAPRAIIVVGDHGEGLGDHGEIQHGNLLYQPTMQVPLVVVTQDGTATTQDAPVSIRRIFHTVLDLALIDAKDSLRSSSQDVVLAEAMKPYLSYGWQPQIMAIDGTRKAIFAGTTEVYDLAADPGEKSNLGSGANLPAAMRKALDEYPVPSPDAARAPQELSAEARRSLASLGYVSASAPPVVRKDAPRPADMVALFEPIERASTLFVQERYREVIPLLKEILAKDRYNLDATLRLATAHSSLGEDRQALAAFKSAAAMAPRSSDVRVYLALHYARGKNWREAVPMLEKIVAEEPSRLPAVEALAGLKQREGRLAMEAGRTPEGIAAFERARTLHPASFRQDLELGVLYLDARRLPEARAALDRVPASHPDYAMALFKRAQVSVLLNEPDAPARIALARQHATPLTRDLIARERLFR